MGSCACLCTEEEEVINDMVNLMPHKPSTDYPTAFPTAAPSRKGPVALEKCMNVESYTQKNKYVGTRWLQHKNTDVFATGKFEGGIQLQFNTDGSIESCKYPGKYLAVKNSDIRLLTEKQIFKVSKGLAGTGISIESKEKPGWYVYTAGNGDLQLGKLNYPVKAQTATFVPTSGLAPADLTMDKCVDISAGGKKISAPWFKFKNGDLFLGRENALKFRIVKALNGAAGEVSLESCLYPGNYLHHKNNDIRLGKDIVFGGNDASFTPKKNGNGVSFEITKPNWYIFSAPNGDLQTMVNKGTSFDISA